MIVLIIAFYLILAVGYLALCRLWCKWLWARMDEWDKQKRSGGFSPYHTPEYKGPPMPPVKPAKPAPPQMAAFWDRVEMPLNTTGFECGWCNNLSFVPASECPHCGAQMRNAGVW